MGTKNLPQNISFEPKSARWRPRSPCTGHATAFATNAAKTVIHVVALALGLGMLLHRNSLPTNALLASSVIDAIARSDTSSAGPRQT
jgi:hypothetical protein